MAMTTNGTQRISARVEVLDNLAAVYRQHKALGEQLGRLTESVLKAKLVRRARGRRPPDRDRAATGRRHRVAPSSAARVL